MRDHQANITRVLLLGGTSEAAALARELAGDERFSVIVSLAGRTANPLAAPVPVRIGGFGGADGLAAHVISEHVNVVLDATHPFAAQISANAIAACAATGAALIALERPPWLQQPGDHWLPFPAVEAAIAALPQKPMRIFSGLGRLSLGALQAAPHHHWLIRVIDPVTQPLELPHAHVVTARGPFNVDDDVALLRDHAIEAVLAKNAGGEAAYAKIAAARALGLPVYMIERPAIPRRKTVASVSDALAELAAHHAVSAKRGV